MARKVQVILSDDLDENLPADETVSFSLDGTSYEIDLADKNAKELRDTFARYVSAARKVGRGSRGASGGGRFDPGLLHYWPQHWTSDNTDAADRLTIQLGTSLAYPPSAMGCHVSVVPNHLTARNVSIEYRAHVALMVSPLPPLPSHMQKS